MFRFASFLQVCTFFLSSFLLFFFFLLEGNPLLKAMDRTVAGLIFGASACVTLSVFLILHHLQRQQDQLRRKSFSKPTSQGPLILTPLLIPLSLSVDFTPPLTLTLILTFL